jgi:hypothetical protein
VEVARLKKEMQKTVQDMGYNMTSEEFSNKIRLVLNFLFTA